jgi:hypothetical protein
LAARTWRHTQDYADAKTGIVREILARAFSAAEGGIRWIVQHTEASHDPAPR